MSKKSRKTGKKHSKSLGDVTINDFANSSVCKARPKKSSSNVTTIIKRLEINDKPWDENDVFEGDFQLIHRTNEDGTISVVTKRNPSKEHKSTSSANDEGITYPLDIWFLISQYIRPEDVGRFAGICKTSCAVVCSANFWFSLYKRYYRSVPYLPERLQPECMVRHYGLRTSVIRSLFYTYTPFMNRILTAIPFHKHPDELLRRQCILMWYQKKGLDKNWLYYFKLKENLNIFLPHMHASEQNRPDILEMLEDISVNQDENCRILRVTCKNFTALPLVLGLTLMSASLTLSHGFSTYRLQLGFGSGVYRCSSYNSVGGSNGTVLVLNSVLGLKILDWWHPRYPHSNYIDYLLNQD